MLDLNRYPLIGISGKQFSGKDSLTAMLQKHWPEFQKTPLAFAIKTAYAKENGLTLDALESKKAEHRPGLIEKGNWGRAQHPDYWIKQVMAIPGKKIISDVRLTREHDLLKQAGAFLIRIEADREIRKQRGTLVSENDPTECQLDSITDWDLVIHNSGSLQDLEQYLLNAFLTAV